MLNLDKDRKEPKKFAANKSCSNCARKKTCTVEPKIVCNNHLPLIVRT